MPIDYANYPRNWKQIRAEILERSGDRCECYGECGIDHPLPSDEATARCLEFNGEPAIQFRGRVVLTISHSCRKSMCPRRNHLKAMCQRCHLRYDRFVHANNAMKTRDRKKGQGRFEVNIPIKEGYEMPKKKKEEQTVMPGIPETPLSKAAEKYAAIVKDIAELKTEKEEGSEKVLDEMEKEGRKTLRVTVGADNWLFTIKDGKKTLRCVKDTRQPATKVSPNRKEKTLA